LACIITGRSWESINKGISSVKFSSDESAQIKADTPKYLREISIVLNNVPREMLLLLKTNDLLRGLETNFNTRSSNSAFIHMTKCCIKLINSYERDTKNKEIKSIFKNENYKYHNIPIDLIRFFKINLMSYLFEKFYLFKINLYELFLSIFNI
jgi:hypothetical protein